ncbi:hypothetical protein AC1031_014646 [Aphanomyces cochlioides]|nr:hypothetical protein AC1031_014646 [Aphanomyces cochlioides]
MWRDGYIVHPFSASPGNNYIDPATQGTEEGLSRLALHRRKQREDRGGAAACGCTSAADIQLKWITNIFQAPMSCGICAAPIGILTTGGHIMAGKHSLPPSYLNCPPLSPEAIQHYADLGMQSAETLVTKAKLVDGAYDWKLHKDESELKIYKQRGRRALERPSRYCGVMQVVGQLDEYIDVFRNDTTDQARELFRRYACAYVDMAVLHTVVPRHADRPNDSTHIKWSLGKSVLDGLVAKRDFVFLETNVEFKIDGKRAWVRSCRSIELAAFPDTRKQLRCRRGYMYDMGFVVVESDRPGYLHMTHVADVDLHGRIPSWAVGLTVTSWLRSMSNIDRLMRENRLSRTPFVNYTQLCRLESRSTCSLCRHKFGLLRKKSNCFKCGDVVCRACNRVWNVKIDGHHVRIRACLPCSLNTSAVSAWTPSSSYSNVMPPEWPALLTKATEWPFLETKGDGTVDDDDVVSVDLSNYADSTRDPQAQLILFDIPSLRELTQRRPS